ncbi:glucoside xylosyltransferase 1-like isoform X1 [Rhagoletis pomonella]|uniref:glucoside xylosyltransferase 1-like isoform X1 n=2 Tax=Rhagoletis pomonella TaxID=28610 RepID=UPI001785B639|nr:glucoside xylosyltransferase 1-like isoform X1 [Rhagoletis pomonella]
MRLKLVNFVFTVFLLTLIYVVFHRCPFSVHKDLLNNSHFNERSFPVFNIALVVCGQRLQESLTMLKSVLLFSQFSSGNLHFWIFAESLLMGELKDRLNNWRNFVHFGFEVMPLTFPSHNQKEWRTLFKPCSSQRLFLPIPLSQQFLCADYLEIMKMRI